MNTPIPNQAIVREGLNYNPRTGILTWRKPVSNVKVGQIAGYRVMMRGKAYWRVQIKPLVHPVGAHKIIWLWMTGHWPTRPEEIDHLDGNGVNNRWDNLRLVSGHSEQHRNQRLRADNTTGVCGVTFEARHNRYRVYISDNGNDLTLGSFSCLEDAVAVRTEAAKKLNYHPNHGQVRPL